MARQSPYLPDIKTLIQAGINPKTGLPIKLGSSGSELKEGVKKLLRIIDLQEATNRYKWYNLPCNLTSQELERIMYFKGQLAFFYFEALEEFYFMPYALDGTIDFYARFNRIHPVPYASGVDDEKTPRYKNQAAILSTLKLKPLYGIVDEEEITDEMLKTSCVLLRDYTNQLSQTIIPRAILQDAVIDLESECLPYMQTAMINASGVSGLRVQDADQEQNARIASDSIKDAALKGTKFVPITGTLEFQELTGEKPSTMADFAMTMQTIDNFRLRCIGLQNGGLFEKSAHELQSENAMNAAHADCIFDDGLAQRQHFCNIVNSLWGLGIWCEASESALAADLDGDGLALEKNEDGAETGLDGGNQDDQISD